MLDSEEDFSNPIPLVSILISRICVVYTFICCMTSEQGVLPKVDNGQQAIPRRFGYFSFFFSLPQIPAKCGLGVIF